MRIYITCLLTLIVTIGFSQADFISLHNSILTPKYIGKEVMYGSNNMTLSDTLYKTIELKSRTLREKNCNQIIEVINEHENITYLKVSKNIFSGRSKSSFEVPQFRKLQNVEYFELKGGRLNCDYEILFNELNLMPNLEYLVLPELLSAGIDTIENFQKIITRIKGLCVKDRRVSFHDSLNKVEELVLHQNNETLIRNLGKVNNLTIKELNISSDTITDDILIIISQFKNLQHLQISAKLYDNQNSLIFYLKDLPRLQKFKTNKLNEVEFAQISYLKSLKHLNLKLDSLQAEDISSVFDIDGLQSLTLNTSSSKGLFWDRTINTSLQSFELKGKVNRISENLSLLTELVNLNLASTGLTKLPTAIGELKNLKTLNLRFNSIEFLPVSFTKLESLESLLMDRNLLVEIPEKIGDLKSLKELNLSYNELTSIPKSIGGCSELVLLNLSNNFIKSVPKSLYQLKRIETLNLASNSINILPNGISKMKGLKKLYLHQWPNSTRFNKGRKERVKNDITKTPTDFHKLENIEFINLSENENLGDSIFETILKINNSTCAIKLENCGIENLPTEGWMDFSVQKLSLLNNSINNVPKEVYYSNVEDIDFRRNPLGIMDTRCTSLTNLKLYGYLTNNLSKTELYQQEDLLEVIMDVAGRSYYYGRQNPILDIYPIAFEIDSVKASNLIDHENYADALFEVGEFEKCIPHYNIAINDDLENCIRVVNFILPKIDKRHIAYLESQDTLSAIHDLQYIQDLFGYNMDSEISMLYYEQGDTVNHEIFISNSIFYYEKMESPSIGDRLSLLELYLIKGSEEKFNELASFLLTHKELDGDFYLIIYDYLLLLNKINKSAEVEINNFIMENSKFSNTKWSCKLIDSWAKKLNDHQRIKVDKLNTLICPN